VKGTRVYPNEDGWLDPAQINQPGAYGRVDAAKVLARMEAKGYPIAGDHPWLHWQATAPDGTGGRLDPSIHTVEEHEDGTITVSPSLDYSKNTPGAYHGWLRRGEWT